MELRTLRYFVVLADELNFGRAAARPHMTQPPLSRAIQQLETDLGTELFSRSSAGVALTTAGNVLRDEARALLAQADAVRQRVVDATGPASLTIGSLADSAEHTALADAFRSRHPHVSIRIREKDLTDPTAGLRAGVVDVALTRTPFQTAGITTRILRSDPVFVVVRSDDDLAGRAEVGAGELAGRTWFRFPDGTDPVWRDFWTAPAVAAGAAGRGPVVRTASECLQSVLWNGSIGLMPMPHALPDGMATAPLKGATRSDFVVAWRRGNRNPLVRSFAAVAAETYRSGIADAQTVLDGTAQLD
ncbi:LysR family transcriptional regulator [Frondihabitans sp. PAMC 28766]|uniref:LysR substrate-binding domain-containing protein n=1 Tax=Frondihabitans sp. PAMC 28766 TaxID=1795630 RepID=UPI00078D84EC|nr:LysR substrate-binding domain-containing protein [Frondihabitans sp. PAMC 28766]AMM21551.1 LysR family transcriptional regulator [Frondihabitans sp. PAMC 28766]